MNDKVGFVKSGRGRIAAVLLSLVAWSTIVVCPVHSVASATAAAATVASEPAAAGSASDESESVQVMLSAADTSRSWDSRRPEAERFDLPVVYLNGNGEPAAEVDRTLDVSLSGLPGGAAVAFEIVSWHENRAMWEHERQAERFELPDSGCTRQEPCLVQWTLDGETLSDYFRFILYDGQGNLLWESPDTERPDLIALDTWEVALDGHTLRVIYARLFGFARGEKALYHRLTPDVVAPHLTVVSDTTEPRVI